VICLLTIICFRLWSRKLQCLIELKRGCLIRRHLDWIPLLLRRLEDLDSFLKCSDEVLKLIAHSKDWWDLLTWLSIITVVFNHFQSCGDLTLQWIQLGKNAMRNFFQSFLNEKHGVYSGLLKPWKLNSDIISYSRQVLGMLLKTLQLSHQLFSDLSFHLFSPLLDFSD
jgi:hypothetical protein